MKRPPPQDFTVTELRRLAVELFGKDKLHRPEPPTKQELREAAGRLGVQLRADEDPRR